MVFGSRGRPGRVGGELSSSSLISSLLFGCRLNAFKKMSRSHGFQRPLHPYQVLSWVIFFGTQALFFTVQLPHLPSQVGQTNLTTLSLSGAWPWLCSVCWLLCSQSSRPKPTQSTRWSRAPEWPATSLNTTINSAAHVRATPSLLPNTAGNATAACPASTITANGSTTASALATTGTPPITQIFRISRHFSVPPGLDAERRLNFGAHNLVHPPLSLYQKY